MGPGTNKDSTLYITLKITFIYLLTGGLWVLFSDRLLEAISRDISHLSWMQSIKGILFVLVTSSLVFFIIRRHLQKLNRSEIELQVREQLFRTVQETSLEGFVLFSVMKDVEGKVCDFEIVYCNHEAARLMECSVDAMIGEMINCIPGVHETGLFAHFVNVVETGKPRYFEQAFNIHGSIKWFKHMAVKTEDGLALCFSDISEHKRAAEELRQERDFSRSIVDNARTIIIIWALDGTITLFNKFAQELTGYSAEEVIGKKWKDILGEGNVRDQDKSNLTRIIRGEEVRNGESQWLCKDGHTIDVLWTNAPFHDADGKTIAVVSMGVDISERKQAEAVINHMAYHDALTNLPNRALFNDRLTVALAHAKRYKQLLAVMYIDLDRFKLVNDTMGHAMGDIVLRDVARRLTGCLREGDTVARVGGDEFILIFPSITKEQDSSKIALKIIDALKKPFKVKDEVFHLTTSIGIAIYPHDGQDADTLLMNADSALYRAKEEGNTYCLYTPAMNEWAIRRLDTERALCKALELNELVVYYQPQFNVSLGEITGMEALLRWEHPERGLVYPGEFIHIAEETGLIVQIGEWVLKTACAQNKAWQDKGYPPIRVVVNLSARQFLQNDLVETVARALHETGLDPYWLELEITEGIIIKDMDYTVRVLNQLRKMGVHLGIDDFGTGYSSLNYLKQFPISTLKIDQSFVRGIPDCTEDAAIVTTIIVLTQNLNLKVVAEGVETAEQYRFLKEKSCGEIQGYLFSKPIPSNEFENLLRDKEQIINNFMIKVWF